MTPKRQAIFIFSCNWMLWNYVCSANGKSVIIKQHGSSEHYAMGSVLSQLTVTSALDCAQRCASRDDCQGSMLQENQCVLYKEAQNLCLLEITVSLDPDLPSRYQISHFVEPTGRQDAMKVCSARNMMLLAINSQLEQDKVVELIKDYCKFTQCCYRYVFG